MNAISDIQSGKGLTRALVEQARALNFDDIPPQPASGLDSASWIISAARWPARRTNW